MIPKGFVSIPVEKLGMAFLRKIKDDLTIVADNTSSFSNEDIVHKLFVETKTHLGVPRGYYLSHLKPRGIDVNPKFSNGGSFTKHEKEYTLREGQEEIVVKAVETCTKNGFGGCVIEAGVGTGKTILSLETARRLGLKTLVIVHTTVLMEQWILEINRFFPQWRVGRIQGPLIEARGYDICVAMLQSISMKDDYPEWIYEEFGTIITDETHIVGSPEFSKGLPRFKSVYNIGISGTVKRKDKCERVFIYTIGDVLPFLGAIKTMDPHVYFIDTGFAWSPPGYMRNAQLDRQRVKYLTSVTKDVKRNLAIARQAAKAAKSGRRVLVLSERVDQLKELKQSIAYELQGTGLSCGLMIGESKQAERDESQKSDVILATVQLVGTGFNEPGLSILIFASPVQSVTQCVGRVTRLHPGKKTPMVLDFVDTNSNAGMILAKSRFKKYLEKGWKLHGYLCFGNEFISKYRKELNLTDVVLRKN